MLSLVVLFALVTPTTEVARLQRHFDTVERELRAADVASLSPAQRAKRAALVDELARYRDRARFPRNLQFARDTPFFIDDRGVRCAMAQLIEAHDGAALVARVAATANNAYVRDLAGNPVFRAWLVDHGLTLAEAARIQPSYPAMTGRRCNALYHCAATETCEPTLDDPDLSICSPSCDPAASTCPAGVEGIQMECQARGDRFLCAYPTPSPGTLGWSCTPDPTVCPEACVPSGDDNVCTPWCADARACPTGYACEPRAKDSGADYLRSCLPVPKDGCSSTTPPTILLGLLALPLLRRRRSR